jgi:hypothetical protein
MAQTFDIENHIVRYIGEGYPGYPTSKRTFRCIRCHLEFKVEINFLKPDYKELVDFFKKNICVEGV